jgi:hypothetical protein
MLDIRFTGLRLSQLQEQVIAEAANVGLDAMMSKRLKNTLNIDIVIVKDMYKNEYVWGDCDCEDAGEKSPKDYVIRLSYSGVQSFTKLLQTLAHELIHVKQFASRQMRTLAGAYRVAYGKEHYYTTNVKYNDRPWEIEAHAFEESIYNNMIAQSNKVQKYVERKADANWMKGV